MLKNIYKTAVKAKKNKMAAILGRKVIISASMQLRKAWWLTYMSKKRRFLDMYQLETHINGFLDIEYPNFDPKHGFLSSVGAEIISFCLRRQPFSFSPYYIYPLIF